MGAPLGLHHPQVARVRPGDVYPSCVYFRAMHSTHHACYLMLVRGTSSSFMSAACTLKGGYLSIATQGSYWLSGPHPLALYTASQPAKPATAETRSRAGTRGHRAERGAKARGEGHVRTSPSNLTPADARTRRHTREGPLILEISHHPEAPATVAPSPHLMQSHVSDATLLSH